MTQLAHNIGMGGIAVLTVIMQYGMVFLHSGQSSLVWGTSLAQ